MISAHNIRLSFDKNNYIFEDFSFKIEKKTHVCFAGESGSGKSSVIKMLQGYVIPEKGIISVDGLDLNHKNISSIRSIITYVPQNINLPIKNGYEIIKLLGSAVKSEYINDLLEGLGLSKDFLLKDFDEISGGQKQRVVIGVCLALDREILLFDEPTAALDSESVQKLIKLVNSLKNKTIVSASHNPEWIEAAKKTINL